MTDIRLKTITVDTSPLIIQNGNVYITDTQPSINYNTGALVSNGGISIGCSTDAISITSGGALTVAGGMSINKDMYIGKNLILDSMTSELKINGITKERFKLSSLEEDSPTFNISLNGLDTHFQISESSVNINTNTESINSTIGGLIVSGGSISILTTTDSISITSGGALTVAGGVSIEKSLIVGNSLHVFGSSNTIGSLFTYNDYVGIGDILPTTRLSITPNIEETKITLYKTENGSHTGFGVSNGNLNYHVNLTSGSHVFYSGELNNNPIELLRIKGDGKIGIKTSSPQAGLHINDSFVYRTTVNSHGNILFTNNTLGNTYNTFSESLIKKYRVDSSIVKNRINNSVTKNINFNANYVSWASDLSLFCAVGDGYIYTSSDLINWTQILNNSVININWNHVIWSDEFQSFYVSSNIDNRIIKIVDGNISGIQFVSGITGINSITCSNDLKQLIGVCDEGKLIKSIDGENWTVINLNISTKFTGIIWISELQIYVVISNTKTILTSSDGNAWIIKNDNDTINWNWNSLAWSPELGLIIVVGNNGKIMKSSDGQNWTMISFDFIKNLTSIIWINDLSIFCIISDDTLFYSFNGVNWFNKETGNNLWSNVCWSSQLSVIFTMSKNNNKLLLTPPFIPNVKSVLMANSSHIIVNQSTGNVGIKTTNPAYDLDINGTLACINITTSNLYISDTLNVNNMIADSLNVNNITIGNLSSGNVNITTITSSNIYVTYINTEILQADDITTANLNILEKTTSFNIETQSINATGNTHTIGNIIINNDKVGINTDNPLYTMDINGSLRVTGNILFTNTTANINSTTASLFIDGGVNITNTSNIINNTFGGALTVFGGVTIGKDIFIAGDAEIAQSVTTGSILVMSNENATNFTTGGAVTILGGASILKDLYVGGNIFTNNDIPLSSDNLVLTGTDDAMNFSSGTIISNGGITIQTTTNAQNVTNGGALLVAGGASIGKDIYIGGNANIYGGVTIYDNEGIKFSKWENNMEKTLYKYYINENENSSLSFGRFSNGNLIEAIYNIDPITGKMTFNNTISSTSADNASVVFAGGVSISCTDDASEINGGALTIAGGVSIEKKLYIGGDVSFLSTTDSEFVNSGAVQISGGVGIDKNLNVGGNISILGNLYVAGDTTFIKSSNSSFTDNIIVLNAGPSGSKDAGIIIERYQTSGNLNIGDVVNDTPYLTNVIISQPTSINPNQIQFSESLAVEVGSWIKIITGETTKDQVRKIIAYDTNTNTATVDLNWSVQPFVGNEIALYKKSFAIMIYNELLDEFQFGYTITNPTSGNNISITEYAPISFYSGYVQSNQPSINSTTGSIILNGGISINNTTDATSVTSGGTFTTLGGGSIGKSLYVGESIIVNGVNITPNLNDIYDSGIFYAENDTTNTTGIILTGDIWGFDAYITAKLNLEDDSHYANYHLRAVKKQSEWELVKTYVGDDIQLEFSINIQNELLYITPEYNLFESLELKWRLFAI